jgi:hypothetical protein
MKGLISIFALGIMQSCASANGYYGTRIYLPSELVTSESHQSGEAVRIRGYLRITPEVASLWDSEQAMLDARDAAGGDAEWDHCITVYYTGGVADAIESAADSVVQVAGTLGRDSEDPQSVNLWKCNDMYITVNRIERQHQAE